QRAAVRTLPSGRHSLERGPLVRPQGLFGLVNRSLLWLVLRPIDLALFQIMLGDLADRRLLVDEGVFGVLGPVVGGADNDPVCEWLAARGGEEAVDVLLLQLVVRVVELALDGMD